MQSPIKLNNTKFTPYNTLTTKHLKCLLTRCKLSTHICNTEPLPTAHHHSATDMPADKRQLARNTTVVLQSRPCAG